MAWLLQCVVADAYQICNKTRFMHMENINYCFDRPAQSAFVGEVKFKNEAFNPTATLFLYQSLLYKVNVAVNVSFEYTAHYFFGYVSMGPAVVAQSVFNVSLNLNESLHMAALLAKTVDSIKMFDATIRFDAIANDIAGLAISC